MVIREETIAQIVHNQTKELELRAEELKIRSREKDIEHKSLDHGHEYALKSLAAQTEFVGKEQVRLSKESTKRGFLFVASLLIVMGFAGFCVHAGKDLLLQEIFKDLALLAGGGGVGFSIGRQSGGKNKRKSSAASDDDE